MTLKGLKPGKVSVHVYMIPPGRYIKGKTTLDQVEKAFRKQPSLKYSLDITVTG